MKQHLKTVYIPIKEHSLYKVLEEGITLQNVYPEELVTFTPEEYNKHIQDVTKDALDTAAEKGWAFYEKEEPKQETLEEAAKDYIENTMRFSFNSMETKTQANRMLKCVEFGAKWQQERSHSEAIEFAEWIRIKDLQTASKDNWIGLDMKYYTTEELFEQFKKK